MKTNTNTLRRALETFAKTGKITLTAAALMALALSAPVNAETVTGNKTISSDYTPSENVLVIGTQTESGTIDVTGGTMNITGGVANDFRGKNSSIQIINGTLTLSNATINTTNGVALNASEGNTASLVVNNGGKLLISGKYPVMGSEVGQSGTLTINEGGYVETLYTDANQTDDITFYVSGNGSGTVNLYGGTLKVSGGLQVARAYGTDDGAGVAGTRGTLNMTGGTLDVGKYFILGHNHPGEGDPNIGIFNMSGGKVTVGKNTDEYSVNHMQYFLVGCSDEWVTTDKIQCQANISGNSEMVINGYVEISNGEWYPTVGSGTTTPSSMTVSDNAQITVQGPYFGVGSWGKLNMNGGSILYDPIYPSSSYGMANAGEMNLAGGKITTTHQFQNVSQGTVTLSSADSSLTIGGDVENSGKLVISAGLLELQNTSTIKGAGSLDISGGELRAKDSTLNYSGKTLNYSGGILPETLNLTNTALAISNTADWNVKNVKDTNGSTLSVAFTPDGTGTVLGNTTFIGFDTADVTLKFASGVSNQRLTSYAMTADGRITYELAAAKNLVQYRNGAYLAEGDTFSDLSIRSGDVIELTADISVSQPASLSGLSSLTIQSDSDNIKRTISGNDTGRILTGIADGELKLSNIRFTNGFGTGTPGSDYGGVLKCAYGSKGNTITIIGDNVSFENSYAKGRGGALYGYNQNFDIRGASFINNKSSWGGALYTAEGYVKLQDTLFEGNIGTDRGGAIYSASTQDVTLSGKNVFRNNYAGAFGAGIWASDARVILEGENLFEGNHVGDYASNNAKGAAIMSKGVTLSGNNTFLNNYTHSNGGKDSGGAIYSQGGDVVFKGDGSTATFEGNTMGGVPNDIMLHGWADYGNGYEYRDIAVTIQDEGTYYFGGGIAEETAQSTSALNIKDGANVTFGGQSISNIDTMAVTNGANVTFQSGAKLTVNNGATVNNATLNLEGGVDVDGTISMENTTANFTAGPGVNGFSTIKADSFSGEVNVDLDGFTVGAMDGNTVTLIDGAKAENVNITNGNLMTNANVDGKTAVTIKQDKDGQYGSAPVQNSELVGIDFGKDQTSMTVKDFSLIVDGTDLDLNKFADWLGDETGLETAVGAGYVNVRLNDPFEIMKSDSFIWDFSAYNASAALQFATVNIMDNAVPEPSTWALLVLGGLGILGMSRRNRKK